MLILSRYIQQPATNLLPMMRSLPGFLHEVWEYRDEGGDELWACIAFGPAGEAARTFEGGLGSCILVFWADSHFEAMSWYHDFLSREQYTSEDPWDVTRYPSDWYATQEAFARSQACMSPL